MPWRLIRSWMARKEASRSDRTPASRHRWTVDEREERGGARVRAGARFEKDSRT
jgi:hypothetical protein